jgi:hypothetical protein
VEKVDQETAFCERKGEEEGEEEVRNEKGDILLILPFLPSE